MFIDIHCYIQNSYCNNTIDSYAVVLVRMVHGQ